MFNTFVLFACLKVDKEHLKTCLLMKIKDKSAEPRFNLSCTFPNEIIREMIKESIDEYWEEMSKINWTKCTKCGE